MVVGGEGGFSPTFFDRLDATQEDSTDAQFNEACISRLCGRNEILNEAEANARGGRSIP